MPFYLKFYTRTLFIHITKYHNDSFIFTIGADWADIFATYQSYAIVKCLYLASEQHFLNIKNIWYLLSERNVSCDI
jgi:hypothetical protein